MSLTAKILPVMTVVLGSILLLAGIGALPSCREYATEYSNRFSAEDFERIKTGMSEAEVKGLLGDPLLTYSRVRYPNGATNNLAGVYREGGGTVLERIVLRYSGPMERKKDFEVFEVVMSPEGVVMKKAHYLTD